MENHAWQRLLAVLRPSPAAGSGLGLVEADESLMAKLHEQGDGAPLGAWAAWPEPAREFSGPPGCERLAGLVLAAGKSRRMGSDKLALSWRGRTLFERALDAALILKNVIVVGGSEELLDLRRKALGQESWRLKRVEPAGAKLQSDSLRAGLAAVPAEAWGAVALLADMPFVGAGLVARLAQAFEPGSFLVPRCRGQSGNPVIIPREFFARMDSVRGDTGARPLLSCPDARIVYLDIDDEAVLRDVDTPEDYAWLTNQPARAEP